MSLTLLQGYSSAEEEEQQQQHEGSVSSDEEGADTSSSISDGGGASLKKKSYPGTEDPESSFLRPSEPSSNSSLPSAFAAFSEVSGPPNFLNNSVENFSSESRDPRRDNRWGSHPGGKHRKDRKDLPVGKNNISQSFMLHNGFIDYLDSMYHEHANLCELKLIVLVIS